MVGLINAAGTADLARVQAVELAARSVVGGIFLPIQRSEEPGGFRVLRSAVEQVKFLESSGARPSPEGEASDQFAQADREAQDPAAQLGWVVDVAA